jgi:hypothetical protein
LPAPAAGWMKQFQARTNGLWALVAWTTNARALLDKREYRFISPVFAYTPAGEVLQILRAGLTNSPALELTALASVTSPLPSNALEARCRAEWDRNPALREEFRAAGFGAYLALCRHEPKHAPGALANPPIRLAALPSASLETRCKAEWDRNPALRQEFGGSFSTYLALCRHEPQHAPH